MSIEQKVHKYDISVKILYTKDEKMANNSFEVDKRNIVSLSVGKDFRESLFPVVSLDVSLSEKDYYFIIENKDDVKILVTVYSYLVDDNISLEDYLSKKSPYMKNKIMDVLFRPYFDDVTPFTDKDIYEEENILSEDKGDFKILNMYLFSEEDLEKNKRDCNFVLNNAKIMDAIVLACNKVDIKDLILEEPHNNETYKQIVCPPLKIKDALNFLQNHYGIYKQGITVFQDFNRSYIIPKYINKSIKEENECNIIYFFINNKNGKNINMSLNSYYDKSKNVYIINTLNNISVTDNSTFDKEIIGDNVNLIDVNNVEESSSNMDLELNSYKSAVSKNKNLIMYNNNKFKVEEYKSELQNRQISISLSVVNIDVSFLTPNKEIVFLFEDNDMQNKFGGHYSIERFGYFIQRQSGGSLDMEVRCDLILNKVMYI